MRIFVISRGCPTPSDPTWGCFELDQAQALSQLGHEVVMLSVDTRTRLRWRKIGISEHTYGSVHALDMFLFPCSYRIIGWQLRQKITAALLLKLYDYACRKFGKPDILYSHYLFNTQLAVAVKRKYHVPLVGIEHWSALNIRPVPQWVRSMVSATYPHTDKVIAVSESLKRSISECHEVPDISVVHNMVGKEFTYTPAAPHPFTFVATGRLVYGKGFDLLPVAFSKIKDSLPDDWQMLIIGGGKERTNLQQQINGSGLQDHIRLLGQKTKAEIIPLLQNSDVFILPSRGENFSVAVLEALACGLPVISSVTGGIRECINAHNGLLFPVNDVDALANALKTIYINRTAYDRPAIAADCQARFSPQVIACQLTDIFQQVIAQQ